MKYTKFIALLAMGLGFATISSAGPIYTWVGGVDNSWNTVGNWDANGVPADQELNYTGLNGDMTIIIDSVSTPTEDVPDLGGHTTSARNTPLIQLNKGTMTMGLYSRDGWWVIGDNELLTVGTGTDAATLHLISPSTATTTLCRPIGTGGQLQTMVVNTNSTLTVNSPTGLSQSTKGDLQLTLKSGATYLTEGLLAKWGSDTGESFIAMEAGATYTFKATGGLNTTAEIDALYGDQIKAINGATLVASTLSEGYLTVTAIPEPATLGLVIAVGGAAVFIRQRFMI